MATFGKDDETSRDEKFKVKGLEAIAKHYKINST